MATRPDPVPGEELRECASACKRWLVDQGLAEDATPLDGLSHGVDATAEFDAWLAELESPSETDSPPESPEAPKNPKFDTIARIFFWLAEAALPVVEGKQNAPGAVDSFGSKRRGDDILRDRDRRVRELAERARKIGAQVSRLRRPVEELAMVFEKYDYEMMRRMLRPADPGPKGRREAARLCKELANPNDGTAAELRQAFGVMLEAAETFRRAVEQTPQRLIWLAPPRTLDEWRACRQELEAELAKVGFTPTEIAGLLPDGAGGRAHRVVMRRKRPRQSKQPKIAPKARLRPKSTRVR